MRRALELGIHCFNLESEPELERLSDVAVSMGMTAPVSVRINPDVDAGTHKKISTGKADKFGIPFARAREVYARIAALPGVRAVGVDMHIGSQITDMTPFDNAFALLAELVRDLKAAGHDIRHVDVGGGLGIPSISTSKRRPTRWPMRRSSASISARSASPWCWSPAD